MRASSKCPRVESFGIAPPPPSSIGDTSAEASVDPTAATVPSPSTSGDPATDDYVDPTASAVPLPTILDDSDIRRMLETVITIQVAHG